MLGFDESMLDEEIRRRLAEEEADAEGTVGTMPAALARGFQTAGVAPTDAPEAAAASNPMAERLAALKALPELSAMPARVDLSGARAADRQANMMRGFERASKEAIMALAGAPGGVSDAELVTQPGQAEAQVVRDEERMRSDVMAQRQAQMAERLAALRAAAGRGVDPALEREKLAMRREELGSLDTFRKGSVTAREAETERRRLADEEKTRRRGAGVGAKSEEKRKAAEAKEKAAGFKTSMDLRKEFNSLPEVKQFKDVDVAFRKVKTAADNVSAAGDLSLIFGYMKMLDPGSAVKETEFANAQNAGGVPDRIRAQWNKLKEGQRLTESQRADFLAQARGLYEAQRSQFQESADMYRTLAEKGGLDPSDVVGGVAKKDEPPPAAMVRVRRKSDGVVKSLPKSTADKLGDGFEVLP
jgi:hypothetical protein